MGDAPDRVLTPSEGRRPARDARLAESLHADVVVEVVDLADVTHEFVAVGRDPQGAVTVVLGCLEGCLPQWLRDCDETEGGSDGGEHPSHGRSATDRTGGSRSVTRASSLRLLVGGHSTISVPTMPAASWPAIDQQRTCTFRPPA